MMAYCPIHVGLKMARVAAGLSQETLSEAIGLSRPQVANIETARSAPSWESLNHWSSACGYRVSEVAAMAERAGETRRS